MNTDSSSVRVGTILQKAVQQGKLLLVQDLLEQGRDLTFPCYQPFDQDIFIHKLANARTVVVVTLKGDPDAHQILFYKSNGVHSKEDLQTHGVPAPPLVLPKNFC